ncbi:CG42535, partial [Drosophila busckii]
AASKKKKSPSKKKSSPKKKGTKKKGKKGDSKGALQICYAIAVFDLAHALYFAVQATVLLVTKLNIFSILANLGTIFWVLIVILLIVGLWKRRPAMVRGWLIFSLAGFIVDVLFLLWGIASSLTVDWDHLKEFTIIFLGILIESSCIYLIYRYYLNMDPCRLVDEPEKGGFICFAKRSSKKKKKKLDPKACKGKY